jgi:hypothetical protein
MTWEMPHWPASAIELTFLLESEQTDRSSLNRSRLVSGNKQATRLVSDEMTRKKEFKNWFRNLSRTQKWRKWAPNPKLFFFFGNSV